MLSICLCDVIVPDTQFPEYSCTPNARLSLLAYYYQSVIVISFSLSQSDHIKWPSFYNYFK